MWSRVDRKLSFDWIVIISVGVAVVGRIASAWRGDDHSEDEPTHGGGPRQPPKGEGKRTGGVYAPASAHHSRRPGNPDSAWSSERREVDIFDLMGVISECDNSDADSAHQAEVWPPAGHKVRRDIGPTDQQ